MSWGGVVGTPVGCRGDLPCRGGVSWRMSGLGPCRGGVSWRTGVVEVCRGHRLRVSWGRGYKVRFRTMSWRHVVGTRVQVTISDHVVGVCRGERVSWRCVVDTALGCRGDAGTRFVFGPCRGGVSWATCCGCVSWMCVVEVCRGDHVVDTCRGGVSWGRYRRYYLESCR